MKILLTTLSVALIAILSFSPVALAQQPSKEKVMKMLVASGNLDALEPLQQQMISSLFDQVKRMYPHLPSEADAVILSELELGADEMTQMLIQPQLDFYHTHLTAQEVDELIEMYSLPVWRKKASVDARFMREEFADNIRTYQSKAANHLAYRVIQGLVRENYMTKEEAGI